MLHKLISSTLLLSILALLITTTTAKPSAEPLVPDWPHGHYPGKGSCKRWKHVRKHGGNTCDGFAKAHGIDQIQLILSNPGIEGRCNNLPHGKILCLGRVGEGGVGHFWREKRGELEDEEGGENYDYGNEEDGGAEEEEVE